MFLSYFEGKGHLRLPSFSLVPESDKSLLLINAGMAPLKKFFTGEATPPSLRLTTCQKCIRTPDIERVGKTSRHATYFEMLGNFSFGDYFKHEAIKWSWDFSTNVVGLDPKDIYISVYEEDDETYIINTPTGEFANIRKKLDNMKVTVKSAEITNVPKSTVEVSKKDAEKVLRLISVLEEHDDIQNVYSNVEISDEILQEIG